jgi:nucleoside-diphosphate kinase
MVKIPSDKKRLNELRGERTLVLLKPDAVKRQIVGELVTRFERKGLKICALKLIQPTADLAGLHYTDSEEWLQDSGQRTYDSYIEKGIEPPMSARDLALNTRRKLMDGLTAGPLVAMVLEGAHVIEIVRKMRGATSPQSADVGTIGFDYSVDSYELADAGDWPIRNIIHASDSVENAKREIDIWFKKGEVLDYTSGIEHILYSKDWH